MDLKNLASHWQDDQENTQRASMGGPKETDKQFLFKKFYGYKIIWASWYRWWWWFLKDKKKFWILLYWHSFCWTEVGWRQADICLERSSWLLSAAANRTHKQPVNLQLLLWRKTHHGCWNLELSTRAENELKRWKRKNTRNINVRNLRNF